MTRSFIVGGLVFLLVLSSCKTNDGKGEIIIQWEGRKATAVIIPSHITGKVTQENIGERIVITRAGNNTAILGEFKVLEYETVFRPTIPFTPGSTYEVRRNEKLAGTFHISLYETKEKAEVLHIYPSVDTVPVNLLKIYIEFSMPMQEGDALSHISLVKDGKDTLKNVFLELQNELWSGDQKMLTVWFDPGRIKRGLQPNETLGPPLEKGHHYQLIIDKNWDTQLGVSLQSGFKKEFYTTDRDDEVPDVMKWKLSIPKANTLEPLQITLNEPLDYRRLQNSIDILKDDSSGINKSGTIKTGNNERNFLFYPDDPWQAGKYIFIVAETIEDLAGNKLDRTFDNDLKKVPVDPAISRPFTIQ